MRDLKANEQNVMLAIMRLSPSASASSIQSLLLQATGKRIAHGTLYLCLDRLEGDGLLKSIKRDAYSGGKRTRFYNVTSHGRSVLEHSLRILERLRRDIGVQSC